MSKKLERSGDEVSEKGRVGRKGIRFPSVASPPPPTPYFRTLSRFSSPSRALGKGMETAATQANQYLVTLLLSMLVSLFLAHT